MTTRRKNLYRKMLVDNNKEVDYLNTKIPIMDFENYSNYTVPQYAEGRIDIISYLHYETVELWWLIAQFNDIINPLDELHSGKVLKIPSLSEYYRFYNENSRTDDINEVFDKRKIK